MYFNRSIQLSLKFLLFNSAFFNIIFSDVCLAQSYIASGCGTYTKCNVVTGMDGKKNGEELCTNASDQTIILRKALWKDDLLSGKFFCAQDDGTPAIEAEYRSGNLHGEFKSWNSETKKWNPPLTYKNGKREGVTEIIGSNNYSRIVQYKNDFQHGYELLLKSGEIEDVRECHLNGVQVDEKQCDDISIPGWDQKVQLWKKKKAEKEFADNNREVVEKWPNGNIKLKYKLVNGKNEGDYLKFYENGKPQIVRKYSDGYMTEEKIYFRENEQLETHSFFKKSWEYKLIQYYQNGKIKFEKEESEHPNDKYLTVINFKRYYDNGQPAEYGKRIKSPASWGEGSYDGEIKFFERSGHLSEIQNWSKGKPTGTWSLTPIKGNYVYEKIYAEGKLLEAKTFEKSSKKLLKKEEFYPDGSIKNEFKDPDYKDEN